MEDKKGEEGREFTRVPVTMEAKLIVAGKTVVTSDQIKDVSLKGLFLIADADLAVGTKCDIVMLVGEPGSQLTIEVKGKVERAAGSGIAVEFTEMGLESYDHLQNLVLYNSRNTQQVEQEFKTHLGIKRRD